MVPTNDLLSKCLRQLKPSMEEKPKDLSWTDKPLHGMYLCQIEGMTDIGRTYQWLAKAGMKDSTEALIMAAQEQALNTRFIESGVHHTRQDPRWRRCKDAPEKVQHITTGWKVLVHDADAINIYTILPKVFSHPSKLSESGVPITSMATGV